MSELDIKLSKTQYGFVVSNAVITAIVGAQGEGKTFSGFAAALFHASKQPHKMRGAIIRDTFENLKRMTIPSLMEGFPEVCRFSQGGKKLYAPKMELDLMGIDDFSALSKLQGAEYSFIWLEEPAPILDKGNSGLPEAVFSIGLTRVARQKNSIPRLQITMNPASEEHWTYHVLYEDPINNHPDYPGISTEVFNISSGENPYISNISRATVRAGYRDRPELYQRYVLGKFSFVSLGESVTPEYSETIHRSKDKLNPIVGVSGLRFWDGGLFPAIVIAQLTPSGRLFVLDTVIGENIGVKQLILTKLNPLLSSPRYNKISDWRDIGDPAMTNKEQSDSSQSASAIINDTLETNFEGGQIHWHPRREALKEALSRMVGGEPLVQVSFHEGHLHRALRGGWHYKKDNSGQVIRDKPIKDKHSHVGDAFSYGIGKILPWKSRQSVPKFFSEKLRQRGAGYAIKGRKI
jgi:hypothetical protein